MPKPAPTLSCILCDKSPTTRAHLFGRTLRRRFPSKGKTSNATHSGAHPASSRLETSRDSVPIILQQRTVLCEECNGGWMSALEQKALPAVADMADGGNVPLSEELAADIAAWAVCVAILRSELDGRTDKFDNQDARAFRNGGLETVDVEVWAVHLENSSALRLYSETASTYWHSAGDDIAGGVYFHMLRHVGIFVATRDLAQTSARAMSTISSAAVRLWPNPVTASWPPARTVEDRTVLRLSGADEQAVPAEVFELQTSAKGPRTRYVLRPPQILPPTSPASNELMARILARLMDS
jgi:hypothetical protein